MVFCVWVLSEVLLFISLFWLSFYASCSSIVVLNWLVIPDPNGLSLTNTVLISNSGISLGCSYLNKQINILRHSLC